MATTLTAAATIQRRWHSPWLVGARVDVWSLCQHYLEALQTQAPQTVWLVEPEPERFLAAFLAVCQYPCRVWLGNPQWGDREWQQVADQCQPDLVWGTAPVRSKVPWCDRPAPPAERPRPSTTQLFIPTGGSSGTLRFALHTWSTLVASVAGFQQHFQCPTINAYCVLPLFHVSGLMQAVRSLVSGGQLVVQSFRALQSGEAVALPPGPWFVSLVPTQLHRLLQSDRQLLTWLQQFTAILLGGGPPWPSLLQRARTHQLPLALTYGMTETASQVATLLPLEFLAGQRSCGRALPHARIMICTPTGQPLPAGQTGLIAVEATSLALNSVVIPGIQRFQTGDLGYVDAQGYLHVLGRQTTMIITGGEKVLPEEVEAALLTLPDVQDVAVVGIPDPDWGETVVAVVVPGEATYSPDRWRQSLKPLLSPYKIPKHWLVLPSLMRSGQGKLNRAALCRWVRQQLAATGVATERDLQLEHSGVG